MPYHCPPPILLNPSPFLGWRFQGQRLHISEVLLSPPLLCYQQSLIHSKRFVEWMLEWISYAINTPVKECQLQQSFIIERGYKQRNCSRIESNKSEQTRARGTEGIKVEISSSKRMEKRGCWKGNKMTRSRGAATLRSDNDPKFRRRGKSQPVKGKHISRRMRPRRPRLGERRLMAKDKLMGVQCNWSGESSKVKG